MNLASEPIENRVLSIIKNVVGQSRSLPHQNLPSSTTSTMIPTPGISNNIGINASVSVPPENPTLAGINNAIAPQNTTNMGNFTSYGLNDAGNCSSSILSDGKSL